MPSRCSENHPTLPAIGSRVRITAGGYKGDLATVTDFYTREDGVKVVEVNTDSGMPLVFGPIHLEILPPRLIEHVSGVIVIRPLAIVAGVID